MSAFEQIWRVTQDQIYPPQLIPTHFTAARYEELKTEVSKLSKTGELPRVLNPFLDELGVSHTQLYAQETFEYAFFRSLFSTRKPDYPAFSHVGLQFLFEQGQWWVRESIDGLPAEKAGIRRGDALIELDNEAFDPARLCDGGRRTDATPHSIELRRGREAITVAVPCLRQNPHASMHDAIDNSVQTFATEDGREIGYVRLWTGTGAESLVRFRRATASLAQTDALIVDLRGGFGGAWYEHLDPFFSDRQSFFSYTVINREGSTTYTPEPYETEAPYTRPMAVLINEGTRSGKEAVAFQFKKSGRGALIGTRTKGAFSAGKGLFVDDEGPLVFFLAVAEYRLDDQKIEGVGVAPDIRVPYPVTDESGNETAADSSPASNTSGIQEEIDPQLATAIAYLSERLGEAS